MGEAYISPTMEPMLTMSPRLREAMCGTTDLQTRRTERQLVSKAEATPSIGRSNSGPVHESVSNQTTLRAIIRRTMAHNSGIVDNDVDAPLAFEHGRDDGLDISVGSDIEGESLNAGLGEPLHCLEPASRSVHLASLRRKLVASMRERGRVSANVGGEKGIRAIAEYGVRLTYIAKPIPPLLHPVTRTTLDIAIQQSSTPSLRVQNHRASGGEEWSSARADTSARRDARRHTRQQHYPAL